MTDLPPRLLRLGEELEEEVGIRAELGPELLSTSYRDAKGRKKMVRYWAIELPDGAEPTAGDGVAALPRSYSVLRLTMSRRWST